MTHSVDLFWSFRSPYSYLAIDQIAAIRDAYDLQVNVRIVYPIAIRTLEFFEKAHPLWRRYIRNDVVRVAEQKGIPFVIPPSPDPVVMDKNKPVIADHQPYIHRLSHLGVAASETGDGFAFIQSVGETIWSGRVIGWDQGDHLKLAAEKAGFDLDVLDGMISQDFDHYDGEVQKNQAALEDAGHWGVPTLAYEGEAFFGQDRIDLCLWRMQQDGLKGRTG